MMIQIKNLVKQNKRQVLLDHLNLEVDEKEIFGIVGPIGAGKSTLIQCLLSLISCDKGEISIFGKRMKENAYEIKKEIGVVMQDIVVFNELTVYENVSYFCSLYVKEKDKVEELTKEAIQFVQLTPFSNYYPKKLGEGHLHRLNMACGMVHRPKLLILDEPTRGADPKSRKFILDCMRKLNQEGTTIIFTTHYIEEAGEICDRIAIMDRGKFIATGSMNELLHMIKLGEKIRIEVEQLTTEQIDEIKHMRNIYSVEYQNDILVIKSNRGKNNLLPVMTYLTEQKVEVGKIITELPTLKDVFFEITGTDLKAGGKS